MNLKEIKINNATISCADIGNGNTTLFFVHGNSSSNRLFEKQLNSSLTNDFRLIAPDFPGHGRSENAAHPDEAYGFDGTGNLIIDIVEKLELKNIIYIGHSLGGHILMQNIDRLPEARGLIISGSSPFALPPRFDLAFNPTPAAKCFFSKQITDELIETWARALLKSGMVLPELITEDIKRTDPLFRKRIGEYIAEGSLNDEISLLNSLNYPVAILHGMYDQIISNDYMQKLKIKTLWKSKIQFLDNGHSPQWETPDLFNQIIREYANTIV